MQYYCSKCSATSPDCVIVPQSCSAAVPVLTPHAAAAALLYGGRVTHRAEPGSGLNELHEEGEEYQGPSALR